MTTKSTTTGKRYHNTKHALRIRKGKRMLSVKEVLEQTGDNPIEHLTRIAKRAEKEGDLTIASNIWKDLLNYVQAKLKAYDPVDRGDKLNKAMTLKQLQEMRDYILNDGVKVLPAGTKQEAIEGQAVRDDAHDLI